MILGKSIAACAVMNFLDRIAERLTEAQCAIPVMLQHMVGDT